MAGNTFMCGGQRRKLFMWSGQYTTVVKDSYTVIAFQAGPSGITGDDVNSADSDWYLADDIVWFSGKFSTTVLSSINHPGLANFRAISCDAVDTLCTDTGTHKMYSLSGKVSTTIKTSHANHPSNPGYSPYGLSAMLDEDNLFMALEHMKMYWMSGRFTSTWRDSLATPGDMTQIRDLSWNGKDTLMVGELTDKMFTYSGTFTTTQLLSMSVSFKDLNSRGIEYEGFDERMEGIIIVNGAFDLPLLVVQGGSGATGNVILPLYDTEFSSSSVYGLGQFDLSSIVVTSTSDSVYAWSIGSIIIPLIDAVNDVWSNYGLANNDLPILVLVVTRPDLAITMVMNTKTFAMSEYAGYEFNSYTNFNGVAVMGGREGIYEADKTDLDGVNGFTILSRATTGEIDIHDDNRANRLRNAFINYESGGGVRLSTTADGSVVRAYPVMTENEEGLLERRVKFERGIKNRVFKFKIENINGAKLELESLTVTLEPIQSRRG
jgi:hypothetical protein